VCVCVCIGGVNNRRRLQPLRQLPASGSGPSERGEHCPIEWGRRVRGGLSSALGVARCGRSAGCVRRGPCRLLCWGEGYPVGVSISSLSAVTRSEPQDA